MKLRKPCGTELLGIVNIFRLFHTLRYLRWVQVTNRLVRRCVRLRLWPGETPSTISPVRRWETIAHLPPSIVSADTARFLNETGSLLDWGNTDKSDLWLYNLHYFDDLHAQGAAQREATHREMIAHWLEENPPTIGVGWEPYPASLRVVNWIKWLLAGNAPVPGMLPSLFQQAHVINQQLEYHLQGNHLLANAKALIFAGCFFGGKAAQGWLVGGLKLLDGQHREQILADGAHFELSPMYHSIILMDVLDLIQLGQCYPGSAVANMSQELRYSAQAMLNWLVGMLHPDGEFPFFNDASFGIAPPTHEIVNYASELGVARSAGGGFAQHYAASGYIAIRQHNQVALLDVAQVGPDYIPGHAHADTLSFEWSLFGQRILVNSGTSEYGLSTERLRQRGTAAHNTVVVNGEDSSEVWSGFRVARRARPFDIALESADDSVLVRAAHDGYQRLRKKVVHRREWYFSPGLLQVKDALLGEFESAMAHFHLHPDVSASVRGNTVELILLCGRRCELQVQGGRLSLEESSWHPGFGLSQPSTRIAVSFSAAEMTTRIRF